MLHASDLLLIEGPSKISQIVASAQVQEINVCYIKSLIQALYLLWQ